jgi:hypothetical protein
LESDHRYSQGLRLFAIATVNLSICKEFAMTFVTQSVPEDKKAMIQALCDQQGPNYLISNWTVDGATSDFLICLSWEEGRELPTRPGLWLFVRNGEVIKLRVKPHTDWGPHIQGIHHKLTVTDGSPNGSASGKIKGIMPELKEALISFGMSGNSVTAVTVEFASI